MCPVLLVVGGSSLLALHISQAMTGLGVSAMGEHLPVLLLKEHKHPICCRWNGSDLDNSLFWLWAWCYKEPCAGTSYENSREKECCCCVWDFSSLQQMLLLAGWLVWSNALTECDKAGECWYWPHFQPCVCSAIRQWGLGPLGGHDMSKQCQLSQQISLCYSHFQIVLCAFKNSEWKG